MFYDSLNWILLWWAKFNLNYTLFVFTKTTSQKSPPSVLTCEGSGKKEASGGAGAWRPVSPEGWRSSAWELCVYLAGQRERRVQVPTACTSHCGLQPAAADRGRAQRGEVLGLLQQFPPLHAWDKPLRVRNKHYYQIHAAKLLYDQHIVVLCTIKSG